MAQDPPTPKALLERLEALEIENARLREENARVRQRVQTLEAQLAQDSSNSPGPLPPMTPGLPRTTTRLSLRSTVPASKEPRLSMRATIASSLRHQGRSVLDFLIESLRAYRSGHDPPRLVLACPS